MSVTIHGVWISLTDLGNRALRCQYIPCLSAVAETVETMFSCCRGVSCPSWHHFSDVMVDARYSSVPVTMTVPDGNRFQLLILHLGGAIASRLHILS